MRTVQYDVVLAKTGTTRETSKENFTKYASSLWGPEYGSANYHLLTQ